MNHCHFDNVTWIQKTARAQWITAVLQQALPLKPSKPLNIYGICRVISYQLFPLSHMCPLKLDAITLLRKLTVAASCSHVFSSCWPFPLFWKLQMWNRKRVKTGSWSGSVWCLELVYFWRSRGRARAVSFLVFYSFLHKLEFDSEPLVTFTPNAIVPLAIDLWWFVSADSLDLPLIKFSYSTLWLSAVFRNLGFSCAHVVLLYTSTLPHFRGKQYICVIQFSCNGKAVYADTGVFNYSCWSDFQSGVCVVQRCWESTDVTQLYELIMMITCGSRITNTVVCPCEVLVNV